LLNNHPKNILDYLPRTGNRQVFVGPSDHYELLDSGYGQKLERFGNFVCIRPEPQALWSPVSSENDWAKKAHVRYKPQGSHHGIWEKLNAEMSNSWVNLHKIGHVTLKARLALTAFKHVGLFPEQQDNWKYIMSRKKILQGKSFLNLFAYTGLATLAARLAGAIPVHLDAVKQVVRWAAMNAQINNLDGIRWIVDDALSFVKRELRRENKYVGIIMDPPAYGHGPKGESWRLETQLDELVRETLKLIQPGPCVYIVNMYSLGFPSISLANVVQRNLDIIGAQVRGMEWGELNLQPYSGPALPAGVFVRFDNFVL